jgi:hypothetical protein
METRASSVTVSRKPALSGIAQAVDVSTVRIPSPAGKPLLAVDLRVISLRDVPEPMGRPELPGAVSDRTHAVEPSGAQADS